MIRKFESYREMEKAHQKDINDFPMVFMFGRKTDEEIRKALAPIGAKSLDECVSVMGAGDVMKKSDVPNWINLCKHHEAERKLFAEDEEHLVSMIVCVMNDHEYNYTQNFYDTRIALGWSLKECDEPKNRKAIAKAHNIVMKEDEAV